jgi:Protein of unknown function (DUF3695)
MLYEQQDWWLGMSACERLWRHHTLSSARRTQGWASETPDRLDLALNATYHHSRDLFQPPGYNFMQPETSTNETRKLNFE